MNITMSEAAARHFTAENSQDLAAMVSTFHPEAICDLQTIGLRVSSIEMIKEMCRRTFPMFSQVLSAPRQTNEWYKDGGLCAEWEYTLTHASGMQVKAKRITILEYKDGLVLSKRLFTDRAHSDLLLKALGSDFSTLLGIEILGK